MGSPSQPNLDPSAAANAAADKKAADEKAAATAAKLVAVKTAEANIAVAEAAVSQLQAAKALTEKKLAEAQAAAVQADVGKPQESKSEPKLRHEFVGMMFAVAIGEVGVQTAVLVQAGNWVHFLPAYSHLFLTAMLIAASWVGWTLSPSPGAREDVRSVFQWGFLVLLLDVFLVVVYFILAKTVDIKEAEGLKLNASAQPEAFWILVIFATYLIWDVVTKIVIYLVERRKEPWFRTYGSRMIPTALCLGLAWVLKPVFDSADPPHVLTADFALLSLVMLFRALKGLTDALTKQGVSKALPTFWTALCVLGLTVGAVWTSYYPLPKSMSVQILKEAVSSRNTSESLAKTNGDVGSKKPTD